MYIAYFDETGDDGFPTYSSELFVLTSIYMHHQDWKDNYNKILNFRRELKKDFGLPVKLEFHTKHFLTDKNPYRRYNMSAEDKKDIVFRFTNLISRLGVKIVNVVINKKNIVSAQYPVLENALTYNIQRIENTLRNHNDSEKEMFLIITDEGRVGKMRKIARKIQKINYIPSKFGNSPYRQEIERLIEDPLPKKSNESYFIQLADFVSYIVFLYSLKNFNSSKWANRVENKLTYNDVYQCLQNMKSVLNLSASRSNEFGIVHYPIKITNA